MTIRDKFVGFFTISEDDQKIIKDDIRDENIRRIFYLSLIAIPVSLLHVVLFAFHLDTGSEVEYVWRISILGIHVALIIIMSIISLLIYFSFIKKKSNIQLAEICVIATALFLLVGGAIISAVDQMITTAINPYIATTIISSIVLLIRPIHSVIYYAASFMIFYLVMNYSQNNPDVLISNDVNGLTISGLGLCLSLIFWRMHLTRIKQHKLIEKQKNELVENFNKLKFYSEELKESNLTKDKLISVIAHDLRSPLASLINVTKLLTEDFDIMSRDEIKNIMISLNKETELTFESLNNLLLWSKTQRKKLEPVLETTNLHQLVENSILPINGLYQQKRIKLVNCIDTHINVFADSSMMQSVIKNLLINSIKFTHEGGHISWDATNSADEVIITIQDNGVGMKPEVLEKLFNPDIEFTTIGTQNEKGTGLGLQICKEFVELNGGRIWAESQHEEGTTFYFSLPCGE
jgi:signal transduction histidine kinase